MFQRTYDPASEAEFAWMVSSLKDPSLYDMSRTVFLQVFFSRFSAAEAQRVIDFLHSQLPRVKIAGMSLYGDPLVDLNTNKFIRLNICQFDESDVQIFEYDAAENSEKEIAADFRAHLAQIPEAKGVLVLGSGLTFKISRFMEDATAGFEEIPFFGAVSNINTADTESVSPYTFGRKVISDGVVLAVFSGANLHFYTEYQFGWKPIGKPLSVETGEACTIGDTLVTKIDGKPATDIYKRYLDVEPDRHFISNICEFPLAVERGGFTIARIPCGFNAKGEINMMGDIKNGETVRFTYGKTDDILKESWNASARLAA